MEVESWRLVALGQPGVGTTTFMCRNVMGMWIGSPGKQEKIQADGGTDDSYRKQVEVDGRLCVYEIYDLWMSEDNMMVDLVIKNGNGFLLAYSSINRSSFEQIPTYIDKILRIKDALSIEEIPGASMILMETKCDLASDRQVSVQEGQALAAQYGLKFFSTSSRTGQQIEEPVSETIRLLRAKANLELFIKKNGGKRPIPPSKIEIPEYDSTLIIDINTRLFNNASFSDLTLMVDKRPLYLHTERGSNLTRVTLFSDFSSAEAILFGRLPSFMEKIKADEKVIDLETSMTYPVVLSIFKYVYTGTFERVADATDAQYKTAIMKWEVFNLLPILKNEKVESFMPAFARLFNLNFLSDLKITLANDSKQTEFFCHKMILCARSEYFRAMFEAGFKESRLTELKIDDCSYDAFTFLLKYYYLDQHEIEDESLVIDLLKVANRYNERQVLHIVSRYLMRKITMESVCYILALCDLFNLDAVLKQACLEFTSYRFNKVAKTAGFKQLSPETRETVKASQASGLWFIPKTKSDDSATLVKLIKNLTL